jgi:hypothetical protein
MGVVNDPTTGTNVSEVGEVATGATGALHTAQKPVPSLPSVNHFRVNHHPTVGVAGGAIRVFQFRNPAPNVLAVVTHMSVKVMYTGASGTAAGENEFDYFRITRYTAQDTTNNTVLVPSSKRPGGAVAQCQVEGVTAIATGGAGFAGTIAPDTAGYVPLGWGYLTTFPTTFQIVLNVTELEDDMNATHPWSFLLDEGFYLTPRVASVANVSVYFDLSWTETTIPASY